MHEAGTSPVTLAQMMGHSSTGIIQTYAKVLDEYRRHAVEKLDGHRQAHTLTLVTNTQVNQGDSYALESRNTTRQALP